MQQAARTLALISGFVPERTLVYRHGESISAAAILADAVALARELHTAPYVMNLCEDRAAFIIALGAALLSGTSCLLPPSNAPGAIAEVVASYPGTLCLCDAPANDLKLPHLPVSVSRRSNGLDAPDPGTFDAKADALIVFTSGSTGMARPHPKRWTDLMAGMGLAAGRFGIGPETSLVATVPSQHMYGLELSILLPLAIGATVESSRPFFPEDIRRALQRVPPPRVLVTTPVHLRACADVMADGWPEVAMVISATSYLSTELAGRVESNLGSRVMEIYGCTEAGSMASRRTLAGDVWRWFDNLGTRQSGEVTEVVAAHLPTPVPIEDRIEVIDAEHFKLLGRDSDLVKIAGKRASLGDLTLRLNRIAGVEDGVFVCPELGDPQIPQRLAAVVVAPGMDRERLLGELRKQVDSAFLPRALAFVDRLPRNDVGKVPRQRLLEILGSRSEKRS